MYKKLIEYHEAGNISFECVKTFNLDEYVGKSFFLHLRCKRFSGQILCMEEAPSFLALSYLILLFSLEGKYSSLSILTSNPSSPHALSKHVLPKKEILEGKYLSLLFWITSLKKLANLYLKWIFKGFQCSPQKMPFAILPPS